jgi:Flp pilus assembly protein CpaB
MTYRLRNIVLAVVLAVLAAFLTALYVASYQNQVDEGHEKVRVYVAKTDIAPGTPASAAAGKVTQQEVLRDDTVPGAVFDLKTMDGQTTSQWIYSGEQLSARRFNATGRAGIHGELTGNFRAVQVSGNEQALLAGTLRAGDHVDVVVNFKVGTSGNVARTMLRDIPVLKAPLSSGIDSKLSQTSEGGFSVILQVSDTQAQKLLLVAAGNEDHEWWLALRGPVDSTDSPESLATLPSVLRDGLARNQLGSTGGN